MNWENLCRAADPDGQQLVTVKIFMLDVGMKDTAPSADMDADEEASSGQAQLSPLKLPERRHYQHFLPPVSPIAIDYQRVNFPSWQTDDEIQKQLGRLAWKTVNTVVTLSEQQRMKRDPAYGEAVSRLRVRQCTYTDLELFNSRVIKSSRHVAGVDMCSPNNITAAAIVATNNLREALNAQKAADTCGQDGLLSGYALDKCTHQVLSCSERLELLALNFTNVRATNSLPAVVPLYVGMPVILHARIISTDLGITNGSQGIVRSFVKGECPAEFPDSKVQLSDLPAKWFPIIPMSWTFTTLLLADDRTERKVHITRHQLLIQLAFAVTGHSAQGKTLPSVLVNLHEGGFGAYIAASHACTREGLCITQPVTLDQLNKPLPCDLMCEVRRFDAIEHHTYMCCGLHAGELMPVPDADAEKSIQPTSPHVTITQQPSHGVTKSSRSKQFVAGMAGDIISHNKINAKRPINLAGDGDSPNARHKVRRKVASYVSTQESVMEVNTHIHSEETACMPA
ncbi:hypothetical protein EV702DRAFT_1198103 [Suillus placidus]|uniref:Uncharacterized protein n=1 Tax=Suillus placidus TaxID=48579 RepID=A0A9P6ZUI6_9AGAM|nr:hypothetical protein EV702DRAFT_1198103 [Suillus placidus]